MNDCYTQQQVAAFLDVSIDTLRKWRLESSRGKALYLPSINPDDPAGALYDLATLMDFLNRNRLYRERVLARQAPAEYRDTIAEGAGLFGLTSSEATEAAA
jgi:hypothetical protein